VKKLLIIVGVLFILAIGILALGFPIRWTKGYLRARATPWNTTPSRDGRFKVVVYRYPELHDIPESFGFGQGFAQLEEVASGKVLAQKDADDLAQLNVFTWSSNQVVIRGFVEWDLPK